ncbi:MAG: hypothetical protein H6953_02920 [Chromatiaceae bacterium]|nr:hypothetical protein [Chromatiaceae bacterium]MCP5314104.1 hypothetical protein [Chromatiaceae bacterium]
MTNETLFFTQIASIVAFVGSAFVLYRLLVQNKDATIHLLEKQLQAYHTQGSDPLSENLAKRIAMLSAELERLNKDQLVNAEIIREKEKDLTSAKEMFERIQQSVMFASSMSVSYFCPVCEDETIEYSEAKATFGNGGEQEFFVRYGCGYAERNGVEVSPCGIAKR